MPVGRRVLPLEIRVRNANLHVSQSGEAQLRSGSLTTAIVDKVKRYQAGHTDSPPVYD